MDKIISLFQEIDTHEKEHGYYEGDFPEIDKKVHVLQRLLAVHKLKLYYHHDEYCWTSWFIGSVMPPREGL